MYPDPKLKRIGDEVKQVNQEISDIITDMFETKYNTENCAALAATQLDLNPAYRITVIDLSEKGDSPLCLINPVIVESRGEQNELEGCMSVFPSYIHEKVKRAMYIKVRAMDREGKPIELEAEGYLAKCIQHEVDHLNGLIYLDRLSKLKRERIDKKIKILRRRLSDEE